MLATRSSYAQLSVSNLGMRPAHIFLYLQVVHASDQEVLQPHLPDDHLASMKKYGACSYSLEGTSIRLIIATTSVVGGGWGVGMVVVVAHESCLGYQGILCQ